MDHCSVNVIMNYGSQDSQLTRNVEHVGSYLVLGLWLISLCMRGVLCVVFFVTASIRQKGCQLTEKMSY